MLIRYRFWNIEIYVTYLLITMIKLVSAKTRYLKYILMRNKEILKIFLNIFQLQVRVSHSIYPLN